MKSSIKNSMKKDEKGKGKLFKVFIKNYFLEILGIIIIIILLFALLNGKKNYNTNNPSNGKVNTQVIHQKDNSKSIKVNYNKNTYELNKGDFDLFVNQYESQGIFRVKPSDLLEGNTIIRFSSKVYLIHITGDKEIIDNIVFRFISNYNNLVENVERGDNFITLYIRRKENFSFYINLRNREKISSNFIKNDTLFYIEYHEGLAE